MARQAAPGALTLPEEDRRILAPWVAACAERVLPAFHAVAPADLRPREAVEGTRAFGRGELRVGVLRSLAVASHAAARSVSDPSAVAAARACGHAAATGHMASHARGVPAYAALAMGGRPQDEDDAVRFALDAASPEVRAVLARLPAPQRSAGLLGRVVARLHAGVGGSGD
jgi:hypothetical protein